MSESPTGPQYWHPPQEPGVPQSSSPYGVSPSYGASPLEAGAAQYGQAQYPGSAQNPGGPAWTQPAKPGLIPLHPLGFGTILGASFRAFRRNPRPTLGVSLLLQLAIVLLSGLIMTAVLFLSFSRLENASSADADEITAGVIFGSVLANLLPAFLGGIVISLLQGLIVIEVSRGVLGEKLGMRALWRLARGRLWALVGWSAIIIAIVLLGLGILAGLIAWLVIAFGVGGIVGGVILGIVGLLGFAALSLWLGTRVSLVPSVLMLERLTLGAALRRSWTLMNGYFWRTLGIQVVVATILNVAVQIASTPMLLLAPMLAMIIDPAGGGESPTALVVMVIVYLVSMALLMVLGAIVVVIQSSAIGLIYLDLRMRKEGLDLDLARFVEERESRQTTVENPYLPVDTPAGSHPNFQRPAPPPWQPPAASPQSAPPAASPYGPQTTAQPAQPSVSPMPPQHESPWS